MACVQRGLHVLVTKPVVMTLEHHRALHLAAVQHNVLVAVEVHKRFDPIYADARDRIEQLGGFSYLYSYMSQPKHQVGNMLHCAMPLCGILCCWVVCGREILTMCLHDPLN